MENSSIILVGAGNVATSLGVALKAAGLNVAALWSRTRLAAQMLGERLGCSYHTTFEELPDADIVIVAVADSALPSVVADVAKRYPHSLVLHTAGSMPMELLRDAGCGRYGVFYPMQTFSKARVVDFSTVSTFVEGCDKAVENLIFDMAMRLGGRVYVATSEQRRYLHLAAVFACNFPNALYAMSAQLMQQHGLPFEAMLPLIDETAAKVHHLSPRDAQTGPARRGDETVMEGQKRLLDDELRTIYELLSDYIQNNR